MIGGKRVAQHARAGSARFANGVYTRSSWTVYPARRPMENLLILNGEHR